MSKFHNSLLFGQSSFSPSSGSPSSPPPPPTPLSTYVSNIQDRGLAVEDGSLGNIWPPASMKITGLTVCGWSRVLADANNSIFYIIYTNQDFGLWDRLQTTPDPLRVTLLHIPPEGSGTSWTLVDTGFNLNVGEWFYWTLSWIGSTITLRLSRNGSQIDFSYSGPFNNSPPANQFIFGANHSDSGTSMTGELQFLRVFDFVITDEQLLAEANSQTSVLTPWAHWPMIEGNILDVSGNNRHLVWNNSGTLESGTQGAPLT
jgi:hypothetical protein